LPPFGSGSRILPNSDIGRFVKEDGDVVEFRTHGRNDRHAIISTLGVTQILAWGSSYYLPAVSSPRRSPAIQGGR